MRIPVAREGWPFIVPPAAAACILALVGRRAAAIPFAVAAGAFLGFFRDPERTTPRMPGALVAPADGKVMAIAPVDDHWVGPAVRLSIFLSPLDVHVNRAPMDAVVRDVEYAHGRFLAAYRPEASEVNERCTLLLEGDQGRVAVRQIAGAVLEGGQSAGESDNRRAIAEETQLYFFAYRESFGENLSCAAAPPSKSSQRQR